MGEIMRYPMKLVAPLKDYIWGGQKLKEEYGKETDLDIVAESWELSCHKDGMSVIANGEAKGKTLAAWLAQQTEGVLGEKVRGMDYFPLLVKLIDAKGDLSVQVHPDDAYAERVEGERGKTELWYVVDCEPGATLIHGLKKRISKEEFARHIADGTLLSVCNRVPVHKGDVFFIPAGTLHAIGKGILICEIQQSSNTTYRVYDYGRLGRDGKPRELQVKKALEVVKCEPPQKLSDALADTSLYQGKSIRLLAACDKFSAYEIHLAGKGALAVGADSFQGLTVLDGNLRLLSDSGEIALRKGESAFLPAGLGRCDLIGDATLILSKL
mgnify:FL=1